MTNPYYNFTVPFVPGAKVRAVPINNELSAITAGFNLLPASTTSITLGKTTYAVESGSGATYRLTMPNTRVSNVDGDEVVFRATHTSIGASVLQVDAIAAVPLKRGDGTAILAGDIVSGQFYTARFDSVNSQFEITAPSLVTVSGALDTTLPYSWTGQHSFLKRVQALYGVDVGAITRRALPRWGVPQREYVAGTWTIQTAASDSWQAVCWASELGLFVAVGITAGAANQVMTSPDGITWTTRTSAADLQWTAVTWAAELGLLVAVSQLGTTLSVMTSTDGITWTSRTTPSGDNWKGIAWSPELNLFVAVGLGTHGVMTSSDGITWTARVQSVAASWSSVTWSSDLRLFVAVNSGATTSVMTSPDGITWTTRVAASVNAWNSVTWSTELSLFVAVASSGVGNRVMTSPDGITWTSRTSSVDNNWAKVVWAPEIGLLVATAVTGTGDRVMTSPDGISWTTRTSAADNNWQSAAWSAEAGRFVAVSTTGAGNRAMTSNTAWKAIA